MRRLHLDRLDVESARRLDAALASANAFWQRAGAPVALTRDGPDLALAWNARSRRVTLHVSGLVYRASRVVHDTLALAWRGRVRFADRAGTPHAPDVAPDARNGLFLLKDGRRRSVPSLTGLLVHEVTHVVQAERLPLRDWGFTLAYLATLGKPFEREAYAAGHAAERAAREEVS